MTIKRIQAPHRMKCENCDVGFAKLVKADELIDGEKHCVYYCEHCKNYKLYKQVERPKRFTKTTSRGLYCWDNITGKRYDAVDDFFEMVDLLDALHEENEQLKQELEDLKFAHRTEMALHRVIESELKEKIAKRDYTSSKLYGGD